jgi:isopenicillin-N N-acyltransferase-like protein
MTHLPLIRVAGTHAEAGRQIGRACQTQLRRSFQKSQNDLPDGVSWEAMRRAAEPYLAATRQHLPWIITELEGVAEGGGLELLDLMVMGTEEIWRQPPRPKCSDFAAGPPATADGGIWLAHNNDLAPDTLEDLIAVEWSVAGQPRLFSVGVGGPFISVGYNAAGLSLTGNEVRPNDDRVGVPRLLLVRDILAQRTSSAALASADHPARASSYNNLIAHTDGVIVNYEGSATDHALLYAENGWTVHTNHYISEKMQRYEANPDYAQRSAIRYERARQLMETRPGPVTPAMLRGFLADHACAPESLCRHEGTSHTVFWCVIDLCHGAIEYGGGNPCQGEAERFAFSAG